MIVMALDHTRDFFSRLRFPPEDLSRAGPAVFFTRWITHFCAPAFFLLAGVGASLAVSGGRSRKEVSRFLFTRGLFLMVLEVTVLHLAWNFEYSIPVFLIVIWALGLSMVVLSALIFLSRRTVGVLAVATIIGHNVLDGIAPQMFGPLAPLWNVIHSPGFAVPGKILVGYPLIPWAAVMALGFALGGLYEWDAPRRRRFLVRAGLAATAGFIVLRFFNAYGNPFDWGVQKSAIMTVASFLNTLKYPPSLHFLLMTLGPILIALALVEGARGPIVRAISVYGRVPMFYYVMHLFTIHLLATAFALWQGGQAAFLGLDVSSYPAWYGTSLPGVYLAWVIVVAVLYIPCRWYADLKARRRDWWLGYL